MKQPSRNDYFLGNRNTCIAIWGVTALLTLAVFSGSGDVPWLAPLICLGVAFRALKAYRQVEAYKAWARDWNALAGAPQSIPAQGAASAPAAGATPATRKKYGAFALCMFTLVLLIGNHQPFTLDALGSPDGIAFLLASSWLVGSRLWRGLRLTGNARATSPAKGRGAPKLHIVQACLPVPRRSPSIDEVIAGLPHYCRTLLKVAR